MNHHNPNSHNDIATRITPNIGFVKTSPLPVVQGSATIGYQLPASTNMNNKNQCKNARRNQSDPPQVKERSTKRLLPRSKC
jgi:hypothetical protein